MTFPESIKSVFSKYAVFRGRACRSEYWWFSLFMVVIAIAMNIVSLVFYGRFNDLRAVSTIWTLATIIPGLAVQARRLHDIDRSGWWILLIFVPIIGWILLLIWYCTKGTAGSNRFGADPLSNETIAGGPVLEPGV